MKRVARLALLPLLVLPGVAFAPSASAATISPTYWDFGVVGFGATSAPETFVTSGESGDNFVGHTGLLGYDPDAFKIVSDGCTGMTINGPEDSCSVSVAFAPIDESVEGDLTAVLDTKPYTGVPQYHAELIGHTAEQSEGGGGKRGGASPQAKKKCKKIKNKAKRKKCLKKLQQQGGTGRRR